ncbi:MAG TPA: hypothetical protein VJK51_01800 [Candidatus Nanoarchaeia archaeon]|nr:hypothetical protein [Candidatus Nanoarchaeia archaeon]
MLFGKGKRCEVCQEKMSKKYSFCPYCGSDVADLTEDPEDYGLLGKNDIQTNAPTNLTPTDNMLNNMINTMAKMLEKQMREMNTEVQTAPNGIRIQIAGPQPQKKIQHIPQKQLTQEQLNKIASLPKSTPKSTVKRLGEKLIYELAAPGITSVDDIFVSKLERGYEVKAIGAKKIYTKTLPVNLPLKRYGIENNLLFVEFLADARLR